MRFGLGSSLLVSLVLSLAGCPSDPVPGTDAGPPGTDAPALLDAPAPGDAPVALDAPAPLDAPSTDAPAGIAACAAAYAGCTKFTDLTGMASTTVAFGSGFNYTPECLRVDVGTTVTLPGASIHPLGQGCGAQDVGIAAAGATTDQTVTFDTVGTYGFFCMFHGAPDGTGMAMAVEVVAP